MEKSSSVIFYSTKNNERRVLLHLRDHTPGIPFPGMIDILGGRVDVNESPEGAIVREMAEELTDLRTGEPYRLTSYKAFKCYVDTRGVKQHIHVREADFEISDLRLNEGAALVWLTEDEVRATELAFGFNEVVLEFFATWCEREE